MALLDDAVEGRGLRTRAPLPPGPHRRTRPRPYLIGSAFPLSGASAGDGIELRNGSQLAIAEINARGGVAGRRSSSSSSTWT